MVSSRVAFRYSGLSSTQAAKGWELYEAEPVAHAVLDRCREVFSEGRDVPLLDVISEASGAEVDVSDPLRDKAALYSLEGALTALWASIVIKPGIAAGHGGGEFAAGQGTGLLSIEEGMRLAATGGNRPPCNLFQNASQRVSQEWTWCWILVLTANSRKR